MSARETAALLLQAAGIVQAEGYYGEVSPAQWMALRFFAGAKLSRTPSAFAEQSITRGTATQSHQSACGRRLPAPAEVGDRWTQRQSATDRQWSRCTRARPVRSSNAGSRRPRYTTARRRSRPATSADCRSRERVASALWRLPGLLLHRRRHLLQLNKHAFIGPRMPAARRSNAA